MQSLILCSLLLLLFVPEYIDAVRTHRKNITARLIEGSSQDGEPYTKQYPGRHVCSKVQAVTEPVKVRESYCRPVYKSYNLPCENGKMCRKVRVTYETEYRDIVKTRVAHKTSFSCCPGWSQVTKTSHGCTRAICNKPCLNGGACLKPDFCGCRPGYTGKNCEQDVDECSDTKHNCEQSCINTAGSYQCRCRYGYTLNTDGKTCNKGPVESTTERDREELEENDDEFDRDFTVEYVNVTQHKRNLYNLTRRINKLEKQMKNGETNEINGKLNRLKDVTSTLTAQIDRLERRLLEIKNQNNVDSRFEFMSRKIAILDHKMKNCNCNYDASNLIRR